MNISYEDDELRPYKVADADTLDPTRMEVLISMGYCKKEVEDSLGNTNVILRSCRQWCEKILNVLN
jgi:hypothetical protein